MKSLSSARNS